MVIFVADSDKFGSLWKMPIVERNLILTHLRP